MKRKKATIKLNNTLPVIMLFLASIGLVLQSCKNNQRSNEFDYPLFISSAEMEDPYTQEELIRIASLFDRSIKSLGPEQVDKLKALNPDFVAMTSVNSSYCSSGKPDFHTFETEYRHGISMYKCATLKESISAGETSFQLLPLSESELDQIAAGVRVEGAETSGLSKGIRQSSRLSLRASTADGKYSDPENSVEEYVTWIQVGNEYMRIDAWDSISYKITVTRGFDGTKAVSHSAGSPVLSPVYIGVLGHTWSGYFPGGFQHMLRYALRIDHPDVHRFKASEVVKAVQRDHLDGVWLDIMGYNFFNQTNMHGEQVIPWNFEKETPYTSADYRDNQQRKAEGIRTIVEEELDRKVIFLANNFSTKYFPEQGGGEKLLQSTDLQPTPLDGLILEGIGGEYLHDNFRTGESMVAMLQQMIDMEDKGYNAFCSSDNNRVRRANNTEELEIKHQHEAYGYAAFLMAVEPEGSITYGIDVYREPSPDNPEPHLWIHPQYFYGIGKPMQSVSYEQVDSYRLAGTQTYCREFEKAFVFLNISSDQTDEIDLEKMEQIGKALTNPENDERVEVLKIGPHTGMILIK
ncbi:MAG: hypothetical protein ACP5E3_19550 [Bacteroidales bacterium]